jgi:hypothetical protein
MGFFQSGSRIVTLAALREAAAAFAVEATNQFAPCKLRIIRVFLNSSAIVVWQARLTCGK